MTHSVAATPRRRIRRSPVALAVTLMLCAVSLKADIPLRTDVVFRFRRGQQPYHKPIDLKVRCYGWTFAPGRSQKPVPYTPKEVFSYGGHCQDFGCTVQTAIKLAYTAIDYCDLEGTTEGRTFTLAKFGDVPFGRCTHGERLDGQHCELDFRLPR